MWTRAEWVVNQGLDGVHHLFEPFVVREAMAMRELGDVVVESVIARQVEELIELLEAERSISRQRDRIANAPLEVQQTLETLGYDDREIRGALRAVAGADQPPGTEDMEAWLRESLRWLSRSAA